MVGGRFHRIAQFRYDYNTGAELSSYDKKTVTPAIGLVVKPGRQVSLYMITSRRWCRVMWRPGTIGGTLESSIPASTRLDLVGR
jgi:hypothetical protein